MAALARFGYSPYRRLQARTLLFVDIDEGQLSCGSNLPGDRVHRGTSVWNEHFRGVT